MAKVNVRTKYVDGAAVLRYAVRANQPELVAFTLPPQHGLELEERTSVEHGSAVVEYLLRPTSFERRLTVHGGSALVPDDGTYTLPAASLTFPLRRGVSLVVPHEVDADGRRYAAVSLSVTNTGNDRLELRLNIKGSTAVKFLGVSSGDAFYPALVESALLPSLAVDAAFVGDAFFHVDVADRDSCFEVGFSIVDDEDVLAEAYSTVRCTSAPKASDCSISFAAPAAALGTAVPMTVRLRNTGTASPTSAELRLYASETARLMFDGAGHAIIAGRRCTILTLSPTLLGPFSGAVEIEGVLHLPRAGVETQVLAVGGEVVFGDDTYVIPPAEIVGLGAPEVVAKSCSVLGVTSDGETTDMRFGDRAQLIMTLSNAGSAPANDVSFEFLVPPELTVESDPVAIGELLPGAEYTKRFDVVMRRSVAGEQPVTIRPRVRYDGGRFRTLPGVPILLRGTARLVALLAELVRVGSDRYVARFTFRNDGDGNAAEVRIRVNLPSALAAIAETVTVNGRSVASTGIAALADVRLRDLIVGGVATIAFDMVATAEGSGRMETIELVAESEGAVLEMRARQAVDAAQVVDAQNISYTEIAATVPQVFLSVADITSAPLASLWQPVTVVSLERESEQVQAAPFATIAPESSIVANAASASHVEASLAPIAHDVEAAATSESTSAEPTPSGAFAAAPSPENIVTLTPPTVEGATVVPEAVLAAGAGTTMDPVFATSANIVLARERVSGYLQILALRTLLPQTVSGSGETQAAYETVRSLNSPIVKRKIATLMLDSFSPNAGWIVDLISPDLRDALCAFVRVALSDETLDTQLARRLVAGITGAPSADVPMDDPRATAALLALVDGSLITPALAVVQYCEAVIGALNSGWDLAYPIPTSVEEAFAAILAGVQVPMA